MPPKKSVANGDVSDAGGPFKWEGPNDLKLLLLTQGRYVKPDEYPQLSSAFPGTSVGSIRNRISMLRVKQRDLYLELAWELPEGGAGHSAMKATKNGSATPKNGTPRGKKRVADGAFDDVSGEEVKTPSKKARGRKAKGVEKEKESGEEGEDGGVEEDDVSMGKRVKEEEVEEMV
ncbi:hypothetical protein ACET3X_008729 [Alternaria dauci]|uniref:Uncharacterized protein n=1 Tax=Alternaria dauci TaxID=48095 RepID=A0ABR3UB69_9PLEO